MVMQCLKDLGFASGKVSFVAHKLTNGLFIYNYNSNNNNNNSELGTGQYSGQPKSYLTVTLENRMQLNIIIMEVHIRN